jgi:hypothetical protein
MALAAIVSYVLTTQSGDTATEVALADSEAESYVTQPDEDSR